MDMAQAETGKSRTAAQEEVLDISMTSRHYARVAPKLLRPRRVSGMLPGLTKTVVRYQPKGVVGVISPWNYPMTLAVSDAIAALLAGNAVVLKPDSQTPYCALACVELLYKAGLPRDLFAVVPGPAPSSAPPWSRTPITSCSPVPPRPVSSSPSRPPSTDRLLRRTRWQEPDDRRGRRRPARGHRRRCACVLLQLWSAVHLHRAHLRRRVHRTRVHPHVR